MRKHFTATGPGLAGWRYGVCGRGRLGDRGINGMPSGQKNNLVDPSVFYTFYIWTSLGYGSIIQVKKMSETLLIKVCT